jgi:hypothetical protein
MRGDPTMNERQNLLGLSVARNIRNVHRCHRHRMSLFIICCRRRHTVGGIHSSFPTFSH